MESISLGPAVMKLTNKILGATADNLLDILKESAAELGVDNIAYVRMQECRLKPFDGG